MSDTPTSSKVSGIKVILALMPALLIVSVCVALYLGANEEQEKSKPVKGEVTIDELTDYLDKLNRVIEVRDLITEDGKRGLKQTWSMVQGTLEPPNLGYEVFKKSEDPAGGLLWPTLWINSGDEESQELVVLAIPYGESGTACAFGLGFAEYLTTHEVSNHLRIVYYPPLVEGDLRSWIWSRCGGEGESLKSFVQLTGNGPELQWATVIPSVEHLDFLSELVNKTGWSGNIGLDGSEGSEISILFSEEGNAGLEDQAQRLIRMMPMMKELVERLGE